MRQVAFAAAFMFAPFAAVAQVEDVLREVLNLDAPLEFAPQMSETNVGRLAAEAPLAEMRWVDRVTGEHGDITLQLGQKANLGGLDVVIDACRYPADNIAEDAFAFVTITENDAQTEWFTGWMVASSPALNALEHPRYDIWALRCKTS